MKGLRFRPRNPSLLLLGPADFSALRRRIDEQAAFELPHPEAAQPEAAQPEAARYHGPEIEVKVEWERRAGMVLVDKVTGELQPVRLSDGPGPLWFEEAPSP